MGIFSFPFSRWPIRAWRADSETDAGADTRTQPRVHYTTARAAFGPVIRVSASPSASARARRLSIRVR
eukprot:283196-Prorocentrum_minimum.AAC.1